MGNFSWNVTKALLDAMPEVEKEVQCIAAYLSDGITWSRIRGLVTRSRADGGLGLMEPLGREAQDFFQESCGAVVDGRPESVYNILRFLGSRELVLRQAVGQDLERRNLGQDARSAFETRSDDGDAGSQTRRLAPPYNGAGSMAQPARYHASPLSHAKP